MPRTLRRLGQRIRDRLTDRDRRDIQRGFAEAEAEDLISQDQIQPQRTPPVAQQTQPLPPPAARPQSPFQMDVRPTLQQVQQYGLGNAGYSEAYKRLAQGLPPLPEQAPYRQEYTGPGVALRDEIAASSGGAYTGPGVALREQLAAGGPRTRESLAADAAEMRYLRDKADDLNKSLSEFGKNAKRLSPEGKARYDAFKKDLNALEKTYRNHGVREGMYLREKSRLADEFYQGDFAAEIAPYGELTGDRVEIGGATYVRDAKGELKPLGHALEAARIKAEAAADKEAKTWRAKAHSALARERDDPRTITDLDVDDRLRAWGILPPLPQQQLPLPDLETSMRMRQEALGTGYMPPSSRMPGVQPSPQRSLQGFIGDTAIPPTPAIPPVQATPPATATPPVPRSEMLDNELRARSGLPIAAPAGSFDEGAIARLGERGFRNPDQQLQNAIKLTVEMRKKYPTDAAMSKATAVERRLFEQAAKLIMTASGR